MTNTLPIQDVLPELLSALRARNSAVLIAPPGAGKTTAVAPALLNEPWCDGEIILLSPRRIAARAAAERIAFLLGEKVGEQVGYLTRLDAKRSARTRILVMTEAIFVARIQGDQELSGVSAILFDEAHERHLDSDLGLAMALESQSILRDDLRILVMSATIDGTRFAELLGDGAQTIESEGKAWPLTLKHMPARPELRLEQVMVSAILAAWREEDGDILAFLPGVGEIERVRGRLEEKLPQTPVLPLHGQVDPVSQRAAIVKDVEGRRRIVLATSIAETSITLEGVSIVVDSGLSRRAEFDRAAGVSQLATRRSSRAASAQRAGRAARTGPGVAYRLWEEAAHAGREAYDPPEMLTADLAPLVLSLAQWGVDSPDSLRWLDNPPAASIGSAQQRLQKLGALDELGRITLLGEQIAQMPMEPELGAAVLFGARSGQAMEAAQMALLIQERGLGGRGEDLSHRLSRWNGDRSRRAEASRKLAGRWAKNAERLVGKMPRDSGLDPALFLALARPDFVARSRGASGEQWISAGGRGFLLDAASSLARADWLVIGDAQGQAKGARITGAAALSIQDVERHLGSLMESRTIARWNASEGRVEARLERRMGAITLATGPDPDPDPAIITAMLVEKALEKLADILPASLLARGRFAGIESLGPESLHDNADQWLVPLLGKRRDLDLPRGKVADAVLNLLSWDEKQALDRLAPKQFTSPVGSHHAIDYGAEAGPSVEIRVQALFGLDRHPVIGTGKTAFPLLLQLTNPAGRPIQATRDLPGFWRGSWADVAKDGKGRYRRHRWPDEPWTEKPSLKTKNAFNRS